MEDPLRGEAIRVKLSTALLDLPSMPPGRKPSLETMTPSLAPLAILLLIPPFIALRLEDPPRGEVIHVKLFTAPLDRLSMLPGRKPWPGPTALLIAQLATSPPTPPCIALKTEPQPSG